MERVGLAMVFVAGLGGGQLSPPGPITAIVEEKRALIAGTPLRPSRYFKVSPQFRLKLHSELDLRVARRAGWGIWKAGFGLVGGEGRVGWLFLAPESNPMRETRRRVTIPPDTVPRRQNPPRQRNNP